MRFQPSGPLLPACHRLTLSEPVSCIVGAFHAQYHTKPGNYVHEMGIVKGGSMALLAGVGPMGMGAIDYALHCDRRPGRLVVTDIVVGGVADQAKLQLGDRLLHERTLKDLRTDHETGNSQGVLDGDLDPFVHAFLMWRAGHDHKRG